MAPEPDLPAHTKEEQGKLLPSDKPRAVLSEQCPFTLSSLPSTSVH